MAQSIRYKLDVTTISQFWLYEYAHVIDLLDEVIVTTRTNYLRYNDMQGVLPNGNVVAVKQLYAKQNQGLDEFSNEVVLITGMKHRNLVNLKGCCLRESQRLLVYEYVDNYDVDQILLGMVHPTQATESLYTSKCCTFIFYRTLKVYISAVCIW